MSVVMRMTEKTFNSNGVPTILTVLLNRNYETVTDKSVDISGIFHTEWLWLGSCQCFFLKFKTCGDHWSVPLSVSWRERDEAAYSPKIAKCLMSRSSLRNALWEDRWLWTRGAWREQLVAPWLQSFHRTAGVKSDDSHLLWDVAVLGCNWRLQSLCCSDTFALKGSFAKPLLHSFHLPVQHYSIPPFPKLLFRILANQGLGDLYLFYMAVSHLVNISVTSANTSMQRCAQCENLPAASRGVSNIRANSCPN